MESNTISVIGEDMPFRVIGHWTATDADTDKPVQGLINYGFATRQRAIAYISTLLGVAVANKWDYKTDKGTLSVSSARWHGLSQFKGSYRVAQYINN